LFTTSWDPLILLLLDERITHFITSTFHVFVITRCVTRYKVIEMWWLSGIENFVREMILYSIHSETLSQWRDFRIGVSCWNFGAWTTVRARAFWMCWRRFIWYLVVQKVAVVKLGVYDGGENGGVKFKVWTNTAKSTNMMIAGFRQCGDLIGQWEMFIKYEARVASRLSSVYWSRWVVNLSQLPFKSCYKKLGFRVIE